MVKYFLLLTFIFSALLIPNGYSNTLGHTNGAVGLESNITNEAVIYIIKNGGGSTVDIFHDYEYLGAPAGRNIIKLFVAPGVHNLTAVVSKDAYTLQLDAVAGEEYYIYADPGEDQILFDARSDAKSNKDFHKDLGKDLDYLTPNLKDRSKASKKYQMYVSAALRYPGQLIEDEDSSLMQVSSAPITSIYSQEEKINAIRARKGKAPKSKSKSKNSIFSGITSIVGLSANTTSTAPTSSVAATTTSVKVEEVPTETINFYKAAQAELINTLEKTEGIDANLKWDILKMSNDQLKTGFSLTNASFNDEYESDLQQIDKLALSGEEKYIKFKRMQESGDADSANIEDQAAGIASIIAEKNGFVLQSPDAADASSGPSTEEAATDIASIATTSEDQGGRIRRVGQND